jgi:RNA polymerase sigma factor (sigma-70 family)
MQNTLTDADLIRAYLDGNKASFDALVLRYSQIVFSVAVHYVKDQSDAEDVVQDVFVKVLRHVKRFDLEKPFKPWILQITRNQAMDWLKKKRPVSISSLETEEGLNILEAVPDPAPLPDAVVSQIQLADEVAANVKKLSLAERKILFFRYMKDFSFREISEELDEVVDTVKSRHRRALQKLRKIRAESSKVTS